MEKRDLEKLMEEDGERKRERETSRRAEQQRQGRREKRGFKKTDARCARCSLATDGNVTPVWVYYIIVT
jgi:hypothetical protein